MHPLNVLEHLDGYRQHFTDVPLWRPYVEQVCARHGLEPALPVTRRVPGTCPVFVAGGRYLVKFFGRLFDGARSFAVEQEANRLIGLDQNIRAARLLASGALNPEGAEWRWPYLIFEYLPSISIGEVLEQVAFEDRLRSAAELGETVRRLHALPLAGSRVFPDSHQPYIDFLTRQRAAVIDRQREWGMLPERLIAQIEDFLPPVEELVDPSRPPHLVHADLTADHLLGRLENGRWASLALIDFGDAMTGDLVYELCALHMDLFRADRRLLAVFLDAYGLPAARRENLPRKALATMLLHPFNMFFGIEEKLEQAATLEALAEMLWRIEKG